MHLKNSRLWHLSLPVAVLLLAFFWRILIFDYGLPYVHNVDEPNMYVMANDLRGLKDAGWRHQWLLGYPPGYIRLEATILDTLDSLYQFDIYQDMGMYMVFMRYIAMLFDMVTLSLIMLITRLVGSRGVAALAGIIWALAAPIAYNAITALPDPPMLMFCAFTTFFTLMAFRRQSLVYGFAATIAGMLVLTFKYPAAPALMMPGMFFLYWLYTRRIRALLPSAIALIMIGITVYALLLGNSAGDLGIREANAARAGFISNIVSVPRWLHTMDSFTDSISMVLFITGIIALIIWIARRGFRHRPFIAGLVFTGLLVLLPVPGYIALHFAYPLRYTWPASFFFIIAGSLLVYDVFLRPLPLQRRKILLAVFTLITAGSLLPQALAQIDEYRRPYTYYQAQVWVEENLPETNNVIISSQHMAYRALARDEGGYSGFKQFASFLTTDRSWQDIDFDKMNYVFVRDIDVERWADLFPDWPHPDDLIMLKHFDNVESSGEALSFYVNKTMPHEEEITLIDGLNQLILHGLVADLETIDEEQQITFSGYWQAGETGLQADYTAALHLTPVDDMNTVLAQQDYQPGRRPTSTWNDPDELLEATFQPFMLPDDLPPGDYALRLILYEWQSGRRMMLDDTQDRMTILEFTIDP